MRISEVAQEVGVPTSTVRYYERIGLVPSPTRTTSGYRSYDDQAVARLRFVVRAKRLGLTLEQIAELLPVWDGVNCTATHDEITRLVEAKRGEVLARIEELKQFAEQLVDIGAELAANPPPATCLPDLSCCVPESDRTTHGVPVRAPIRLHPTRSDHRRSVVQPITHRKD